MIQAKTVVITGSTRGIGRGLAESFLAAGCRVMVSGRSADAVKAAATQLGERHGADRVGGQACEVTEFADVEALWGAAVARFGRVDIWINNAGITNGMAKLWDVQPKQFVSVMTTNVVGTLYGCRVAMRKMMAQKGGAIYNMEGLGADGRIMESLGLYGSTKRCVAYLTDALAKESRDSSVIVGGLRPGMVMTDFILQGFKTNPAALEQRRRMFNIIADRVENVAPWLVSRILTNNRTGVHFNYVNGPKMLWRFASAPFFPRNVVP